MAAALLLHGTTFMLADHGNQRFLLELLGASLAPYVIVGGTAYLSPWITWLWPALALMLAADVAAFVSVFVWPTDAQSSLILLFMPLYNVVIVLPAALLLAATVRHVLARRRRRS